MGTSGGGSSSGEIKYPSWMETWHSKALGVAASYFYDQEEAQVTFDLWAAHTTVGGNPFDGASAYDPMTVLNLVASSPLGEMVETAQNMTFINFGNNLNDFISNLLLGSGVELLDPVTTVMPRYGNIRTVLYNYASFPDMPTVSINPSYTWDALGDLTPFSVSDPADIAYPTLSAPSDLSWGDYSNTVPDITLSAIAAPSDISLGAVSAVGAITVPTLSISSLGDAIDSAASAFAVTLGKVRDRDLARFKAGMADINSVHTSTFVIGTALITEDIADQVARFTEDLTIRALLQERELEYKSEGDQRSLDIQAQVDARKLDWEADMQDQRLALDEDMSKRELVVRIALEEMKAALEEDLDQRRLNADLTDKDLVAALQKRELVYRGALAAAEGTFKGRSDQREMIWKEDMDYRRTNAEGFMDKRRLIAQENMTEAPLEYDVAKFNGQMDAQERDWVIKIRSDLDHLATQLTMHTQEMHHRAVIEGVGQGWKMTEASLQHWHRAASLLVETYRMAIVALKEQVDMDYALDQKDKLWDLQTWQYGANVLGAIAGAASSTFNPSENRQSALGGALAGASAGAGLAMAIPGIGLPGIGIAAGIGGLFGGLT